MADLATLNGTYTIDPAHSTIGFVARHAMVTKVRGSFDDLTGQATTGPNLADAHITVTLQVASVDTRQEQRDEHLRGTDFFDAATYPTITFTSTAVKELDPTTLQVTGDLTIKDVTRSLTIDFDYNGSAKDPFGNERIGFEGSVAVSRADFGLTWNAALETGGLLVSDKVTLEFDISAIKSA